MKFKIDLEERELEIILEWLGNQDSEDTKYVIDTREINMDYEEADKALSSLFLELRDKCPIEFKYNLLSEPLNEHTKLLHGEIDKLNNSIEGFKSMNSNGEFDYAIENLESIMHHDINEYEKTIRNIKNI